MTTSPTTFEDRFRHALLELVHEQWRALGVPFETSLAGRRGPAILEVIDPEALVWCSLEWIPAEPRLEEGIRAWLRHHRGLLIGQRLKKFAAGDDPRAARWKDLLSTAAVRPDRDPKPIGEPSAEPATLSLRARDVLGHDCRAFLLVELLGSPRGVRLRDVAGVTGYAYRSVSGTASGWHRAGLVRIRHGQCVLANPAPWCEILRCRAVDIVTVDWSSAYRASIELLRLLTKARGHGFGPDHPLVDSAIRSTDATLEVAARGIERGKALGLETLRAALVRA